MARLRDSAGGHVAEVNARLFEQAANPEFSLFVCALAEVGVANEAILVHEILGGPVAVVECAPCLEVVILRDGPLQPEALGGFDYIVAVLLEVKLGCVDTDDDEAVVGVLLMPRLEVR